MLVIGFCRLFAIAEEAGLFTVAEKYIVVGHSKDQRRMPNVLYLQALMRFKSSQNGNSNKSTRPPASTIME